MDSEHTKFDAQVEVDGIVDYEKASQLVANDRRASIASIENAQLVEQIDARNGQFHRSFTPRQVHVSTITQPALH